MIQMFYFVTRNMAAAELIKSATNMEYSYKIKDEK